MARWFSETVRGVPPEVWDAVMARDGYRCQASAFGFGSPDPCAGALIVHHRRLRSQGGAHDLDNLVALCGGVTGTGGHHGEVHSYPSRAYACGLLLRTQTSGW